LSISVLLELYASKEKEISPAELQVKVQLLPSMQLESLQIVKPERIESSSVMIHQVSV